jgi:hypothetical protein
MHVVDVRDIGRLERVGSAGCKHHRVGDGPRVAPDQHAERAAGGVGLVVMLGVEAATCAASRATETRDSYATPVAANLPRSVLRNRESFPFALIS